MNEEVRTELPIHSVSIHTGPSTVAIALLDLTSNYVNEDAPIGMNV